jgi:RHS repeat-associated protein
MFGLINMNGRVYDPLISRFLNVDPIIQNPYSSHDLNNYSYCINNPLKYIDPSGYARARSYDAITITDPGDIEVFLREYFNHGGNLQYAESQVSGWKTTAIRYDEKTGFAEFWIRMPASYENFDNRDCPTNAHSSKTLVIRETKVRVYLEPLQYFSEICFNGSNATASGGGDDWINTAIDHTGKTIGGAIVVNGGVKTVAKEYVRQVDINNKLAGIKNAKLPNAYNTAKGLSKKLGVVGGVIVAADVAYNSQVNTSDLISATMTGIAFTGWGAPIAVLWFVADFGTGLITGTSISDRIDSTVGTPLLDWDY